MRLLSFFGIRFFMFSLSFSIAEINPVIIFGMFDLYIQIPRSVIKFDMLLDLPSMSVSVSKSERLQCPELAHEVPRYLEADTTGGFASTVPVPC